MFSVCVSVHRGPTSVPRGTPTPLDQGGTPHPPMDQGVPPSSDTWWIVSVPSGYHPSSDTWRTLLFLGYLLLGQFLDIPNTLQFK